MMNFRKRRRRLNNLASVPSPLDSHPDQWRGVEQLEPRLLMTAVTETDHVFSSGGGAGDQFGQSIDISGDLMIVGASGRDTAGNNAGAAQIFQRNGSNWNLVTTLTAGDAGAGDIFGTAVAIDGNFAVVTAAADNAGAGANSGSAYVFELIGGTWTEIAKLAASDGGSGDFFGASVDINNGRIVIGALQDDDGANNMGSAYIFEDTGAGFTQTAKLLGDATASAQFGVSVSISGDYAIIGANGDSNAAGTNAGAAYIFRNNSGQWQEQAKLKSSDLDAFDQFGVSVSIHNDLAVVGAALNDDAGSGSGSAYVFERNGSSWSQKAKLVAPDASGGDQFGRSVSVHNGNVAVGAFEDDQSVSVSNSGSVYIFVPSGNTWAYSTQLLASDAKTGDNLGRAVAINGSFAAGGANFDDTNAGADVGSVYVLQLGALQPAPVTPDPVTAILAGDELTVTGTANDDVINVTGISNGRVRVKGTGIDETFDSVNTITINGLAGNDIITVGNNVRDTNGDLIGVVINGGDGDDEINGGQGNDIIDGGAGNDVVNAGDGDDTVTGGAGNDLINGEGGTNVLDGGGGVDTIDGFTAGPQAIIGDGRPSKITFVDADGTTVTISYKGPGTATVTFGGTNVGQSTSKKSIVVGGTDLTIEQIVITDSTAKSKLSFSTKGGDKLATVGEITGSTAMSTISGKGIDLVGNGIVLTGAGVVTSISVHDLLNGADIVTPGTTATKGVKVAVNQINAGSEITLGSMLKSLSGKGDLIVDVNAPIIYSVKTRGDISGSFNATDVDSKGYSIAVLSGANVTGTDVDAAGGIKSISVADWQGGSIAGQFLSKIYSKGALDADITLSGADSKDVSLAALKAVTVNNLNVTAPGGIKSVSVSEWLNGSIDALWLSKIYSKGALDADIALTGADSKDVSLASLKAKTITDMSLNTPGGIKSVAVTDWLDGSITALWLSKLSSKGEFGADVTATGADSKGTSIGSVSAGTITDLDVTAPGHIKSLKATDWLEGAIDAASLSSLSVKNDMGADLTLSDNTLSKTLSSAKVGGTLGDAVWRVNGVGGSISAGATDSDLSVNFAGELGKLAIKGNGDGTFAASNFKSISVGGDTTNSHFLAGAHLGDDGQLGGAGGDADTFGAGSIGSFSIKGMVVNGIVGAGLDPVDGVFNNGNDVVLGDADTSFIKSLKFGSTVDNTSLFAAALFPSRVVIDGITVDPATDPRFLVA